MLWENSSGIFPDLYIKLISLLIISKPLFPKFFINSMGRLSDPGDLPIRNLCIISKISSWVIWHLLTVVKSEKYLNFQILYNILQPTFWQSPRGQFSICLPIFIYFGALMAKLLTQVCFVLVPFPYLRLLHRCLGGCLAET